MKLAGVQYFASPIFSMFFHCEIMKSRVVLSYHLAGRGNQRSAWFDTQPQLRTREAFLGTSIVRDDGLRLCFFGTHFPMQRLQSVLVSNKINDSEKLMAAKIECPGDLVGVHI